jgi:hypothetical protein
MSRRLSAVALAVCALVSITAAQSQRSATRIQEIVLEISIIEIAGAQPNALEKMGRPTDLLDGLISEGKARLITNLQMRTRTEESFNARVNQPRTASGFQDKRIPGDPPEPVQFLHMSPALWQVASEKISFIVEGSFVAATQGLLDISVRLEVTGLVCSCGTLTPMFNQRTFMNLVRVKERQTLVLMAFQPGGPLSSRIQSVACATSATPGSVFVLLTTKPAG